MLWRHSIIDERLSLHLSSRVGSAVLLIGVTFDGRR